jgi:hypothetical protein
MDFPGAHMKPESRRIPARMANTLFLLVAVLLSKPIWAGDKVATVIVTHSLLKPPTAIATKKGVILHGLDARMFSAIHKARRIWIRHGKMLVVTSGLEGRHKKGSLHYVGLAVDLRSRDFVPTTRSQVTRELRRSLGDGFEVIGERHHIHVEYDP